MDPMATPINVYYGARIVRLLWLGPVWRSLLEWLDANGSCERRQRIED